MKKINRRGVSLVEMLIVTVIAGGVITFIGMGLKRAVEGKESFLARSNVKTTMIGLMEAVLQAGRLSNAACTIDTGTDFEFTCPVDTNVPPTTDDNSDDTLFRFTYYKAPNAVACQSNDTENCVVFDRIADNGTGATRSTVYKLGPDIAASVGGQDHFIVCADDNMDAGGSNDCPLGPTAGTRTINIQHTANRAAEAAEFDQRFYRVGLSAVDPDYEKGRPFRLQTAFFRRNPIPGFPTELRYAWGTKEK